MERGIYHDHCEFDEAHWWFVGRRRIIKQLLEPYLRGAQRRILDVGSGPGGMIVLLQPWGAVTALEPDAEMAVYLQRRFGDSVPVFSTPLETLPATEQFECITTFDVLEHMDDDHAALKNIFQLLKMGGYYVCTVPAFQFLWSNHDERAHHKRRYSRRILKERMEQAGFEVVRLTYFNTFLFPFVVLVRWFDKLTGRESKDFKRGSGMFNRLLCFIFSSERYWLRWLNFPFGVSLFCIARKPR